MDQKERRAICIAAAVKYLEEQGAEVTGVYEKPVPHVQTKTMGEKVFFLVVSSAGRELGPLLVLIYSNHKGPVCSYKSNLCWCLPEG